MLGPSGTSFRYVQTFGADEPYIEDGSHLYWPNGIFIDSTDNLFTVEELGYRMLKFNSAGVNQMTIGHAGKPWHHDDFLASPKDVAVSSNGHIWIAINPSIKEFDENGQNVQIFPSVDPWVSGTDNDRFDDPRGLAFDTAGRLYVADSFNHRIQVYEITGGTIVYSTTLGITGMPTSTVAGFNEPGHLGFDSLGRLYVLDTNNYRVQRCSYTTTWNCVTYFGVTGESGNDLTHLGWSIGMAVRNDDVFIADISNYRVLKCNTAGVCAHFAGTNGESGADNDHFAWAADVAVDSAGNVYVSDGDNFRIQKFDNAGNYMSTLGVTGVPYISDNTHLHTPAGIAVAKDGSLYIHENKGHRLLKWDAAGVPQWTVGVPGVVGSDNDHLGSWWAWETGNPAVDAVGRVYIPDTGNQRVQIFTASGVYSATIGITGEGGSDNNHFACPMGVAISPVNGDIYVADACNHRVQVFTQNRIYKTTLGITNEPGNDNLHFDYPRDVAIGLNGKIYVADANNQRTQECTLSGTDYTCATIIGVANECGDDFGHLCNPYSVDIDSAGRLYVADASNNRIEVFGSNGDYLTTIAGNWGTSNGQLVFPTGVAVDLHGNVYIADQENHRIQKFSLGVPGWRQVNINGFGERSNGGVSALEVFEDALYAGASDWNKGGRIFRSTDGTTWTPVTDFGITQTYSVTNPAVIDLFEFEDNLYAGIGWDGIPGQVWRTADGTTWNQVVADGFGDVTNMGITAFGIFNDVLYAGTSNNNGVQIWRSMSGDALSWTPVVTDGLGYTTTIAITGFAVFNSEFFVAVESDREIGGTAQVWHTSNGTDWSLAADPGFGEAENDSTGGFGVFKGKLYLGTRNRVTGAQLWSTDNGTDWVKVIGDGFGDTSNYKIEGLDVVRNKIVAFAVNEDTGLQIWASEDGESWVQIGVAGFGDSNNYATLWSTAQVRFKNSLFVGTWNSGNGGEIWQQLQVNYLPWITNRSDGYYNFAVYQIP